MGAGEEEGGEESAHVTPVPRGCWPAGGVGGRADSLRPADFVCASAKVWPSPAMMWVWRGGLRCVWYGMRCVGLWGGVRTLGVVAISVVGSGVWGLMRLPPCFRQAGAVGKGRRGACVQPWLCRTRAACHTLGLPTHLSVPSSPHPPPCCRVVLSPLFPSLLSIRLPSSARTPPPRWAAGELLLICISTCSHLHLFIIVAHNPGRRLRRVEWMTSISYLPPLWPALEMHGSSHLPFLLSFLPAGRRLRRGAGGGEDVLPALPHLPDPLQRCRDDPARPARALLPGARSRHVSSKVEGVCV